MKKKLLLVLAVICCIALMATLFAACNDDTPDVPGGDDTSTETPGGGDTPGGEDTPDVYYHIDPAVIASVAAAISAEASDVAGETVYTMVYSFDNSNEDILVDYGIYTKDAPTPGVRAFGSVGITAYSDENGYYGDECVAFIAYDTAEQAKAAGISHFGVGGTVSVLPSAAICADYVFEVVGNCVVAAPTEAVLDAFFAAGEAYEESAFDLPVQMLQLGEDDHTVAFVVYSEEEGDIMLEMSVESDPYYSNAFTAISAMYCPDEQERADTVTSYQEEFQDRSSYGEGSRAWADGDMVFLYIESPAPGLYIHASEDGTFAIASHYVYDSPDPVTVTVPAEWNGLPVTLLANTFVGAKTVKEVILPEGIEKLGYEAFYNSGLQRITIPASVTEIDGAAFRGCADLTEITMAEGQTIYRAEGAAIIINENDELFWIAPDEPIPASVKVIGTAPYFNDDNFTSVTIPATVERIEGQAFNYCENLTEIHIEEGSPLTIDTISSNALRDCAWYEAQPDGPLYIDGILVGYKNYVPADPDPEPEPEPTVDKVADAVTDTMSDIFLSTYVAMEQQMLQDIDVGITIARQEGLLETRGFALGLVMYEDGTSQVLQYAWMAYPTASLAETYGAEDLRGEFGDLCDGMTGEVIENCYVLSRGDMEIGQATAPDIFSQTVSAVIPVVCGPAVVEGEDGGTIELLPKMSVSFNFVDNECIVMSLSDDGTFSESAMYATAEARDAAFEQLQAKIESGNVSEDLIGATIEKNDSIEGVYALTITAAR